jgi:hypothetical protein
MADKVSIDFLANDANLSKSMDKQVRDTVRAQNANESRAKQSRSAAADEVNGWKSVQSEIDAVVRKMQDLKRARGELIAGAPNWQHATRGGGPLGPYRGVNFAMYGAPPPLRLTGPGASPNVPLLGYRFHGAGTTTEAVGGQLRRDLMIDRAERMMGNVSNALSEGVGHFLGGVAQTALGLLTAETALKAFENALNRITEREERALGESGALARGHAIIALNTFGQTEAERGKFRSAAQTISSKSFLPEALVAEVLGEQAGRGANLSADQIIQATDVAAQLTKHTPEQFKPTAAGVQQIMRIGNVDANKAASLFQSAAAAAYPGNPELQARMIQQSIAVAIANSPVQDLQTVEEIAEYTSAASQVGGEERGEATRTAMAALMAQVNEFRTGTGPWMLHGKGGRQMPNPIPGIPAHPRAALEHIMRDPMLSEMFWNKATFERQYEGPLRDMLTNPKGRGGQILAETQKLVGVNEPALEEQIRAVTGGSPQLATRTDEQGHAVVASQQSARDQINAKLSILRSDRNKALNQFSAGGYLDPLGNFVNADLAVPFMDRFSSVPAEDRFLSDLKGMRDTVANPSAPGPRLRRAMGYGPSSATRDNDVQYLDRLIKAAEATRDEIKKLREEKPVPTAGPAANAEVGRSRER